MISIFRKWKGWPMGRLIRAVKLSIAMEIKRILMAVMGS